MKALVLGASGQVGRALITSAPSGIEVIGLDRSSCDVGDQQQVEEAIGRTGPDIVLNAAAYTAVDKAESDAESARLVNGIAPGLIARQARASGARLVHLSTDFVFDGRASRPYRPNDETGPLGVYARSKRQGELAVAKTDPDALIVRTAWVYAARGSNFVNTMLRLMSERDEIKIVADQVGTPTAAGSLARALWGLALAKARGIHHFTDAGVASWYDFAMAIKEEAEALQLIPGDVRVMPTTTAGYPTPAPRPAYSVLDKTETWSLLGETAPHWRANLRCVLRELKGIG